MRVCEQKVIECLCGGVFVSICVQNDIVFYLFTGLCMFVFVCTGLCMFVFL